MSSLTLKHLSGGLSLDQLAAQSPEEDYWVIRMHTHRSASQQTHRVRIRDYRMDDANRLHDAVLESKSELARWMPWCHERYCLQDSIEWIERQSEFESRKSQKNFAVVSTDGQFWGGCGLHRIDWSNQTAELGYWTKTSATRQGIASQAVRILRDWAFAEFNLHRLEILAEVDNIPSRSVAESVGAKFEAILYDRFLMNNKRKVVALYSILDKSEIRQAYSSPRRKSRKSQRTD